MPNEKHDVSTYVEWIEIIDRNCVNLTTWEEEFIESMLNKISLYGDKTRFTDAQMEQIERIYTDRVS